MGEEPGWLDDRGRRDMILEPGRGRDQGYKAASINRQREVGERVSLGGGVKWKQEEKSFKTCCFAVSLSPRYRFPAGS